MSENKLDNELLGTDLWLKAKYKLKASVQSALTISLTLFYTARDKHTPLWVKLTVYMALGYFISPVDFISDVAPIIGYCDDFAVILIAATVITAHITSDHRSKAVRTLD